MKKHIIWSNINADCDDDAWTLVDEQVNLNSAGIPNDIVAIADLGLWNGRKTGYKIIGKNLGDCLFACWADYAEIYCDSKDFKGTFHHHDGTNYVTFRMLKKSADDPKIQKILNDIAYQRADESEILKHTKSLRPYVKSVYGWRDDDQAAKDQ